jgi:hypothetical protein
MLSGTSGLGEGGRERETDRETERQSRTQGQADREKGRQTSGLEHEDGRSLGSKSGMVVKIEVKSRSVYIVFIGSLVSMPGGSAFRIQDSGFGLRVQVHDLIGSLVRIFADRRRGVQSFGFRFRCRVSGLWFGSIAFVGSLASIPSRGGRELSKFRVRVSGFGFRVFGFRVSGFKSISVHIVLIEPLLSTPEGFGFGLRGEG